ncbi:MAG: PIG-L family deacetylase [Chloroflexi bacterium]|nr:PIG-L family deacetylase [Chloroflexota bacterium]
MQAKAGAGAQTQALLAVFAHPDDETFLAGPLLARCARQGVRVEIVCGTPPEPAASDRSDWEYRHRQALLCAAEALGAQRVHFLGYEGSPMSPVADPSPRMLAAAPPAEVAEAVGRIMEEAQPDIVLTDSPYGAYGHPDHIMMHRACVIAFAKHKKDNARLYCLAYPLPLVRLNLRLMGMSRRVGIHALGPRGDIDLAAIVKGAPGKTALVNTSHSVRFRRIAARCYEEDIRLAPLPLKLLERSPLWAQRLMFRRTALTRLEPPTQEGEALEREIVLVHRNSYSFG